MESAADPTLPQIHGFWQARLLSSNTWSCGKALLPGQRQQFYNPLPCLPLTNKGFADTERSSEAITCFLPFVIDVKWFLTYIL